MATRNVEWLDTSLLDINEGQMEGLPKNPRSWTKDELNKLKKSLEETPELFEARPILAYDYDGRLLVLGGNMRLSAAKALGMNKVPVYVYPSSTPLEKLKEIVIKDNGVFGAWDWDMLANEWDALPLSEWGVPTWKVDDDTLGLDDESHHGEKGIYGQADDRTEDWMNEAMVENALETTRQIDYMMREGWLPCGYTLGMAKRMFLRAKFYGANLPQWFSYYFIPERIFCPSGSKKSMYEQLASTRVDSGCSGLRTIQETGRGQESPLLLLLQKGQYPIGEGRLPLDFPAGLAADLILEFAGRHATILDPCHGWGGRLAGALLADVAYYEGYDPSPYAHRGVNEMASAFSPYVEGAKVCLFEKCYEDATPKTEAFDFAITSPPYYDVELYEGQEQAHNRYNSFEKWVDGFYDPLIAKTYDALKHGGVFVLQVGSQRYPLLSVGREIAERVGFKCVEVRPFGHGTSSPLHGNTDADEENEKIMILKKG